VKTSAGILPYRVRDGALEVLVAHMGGPLWAKKDERAWSVIKGEFDPATETALDAARREFAEETGADVPPGELIELGEVKQSSKTVVAFAVLAADLDPAAIVSNTFTMEWPPRSGRTQEFPEIDRAAWLDAPTAKAKLVSAQAELIDRLQAVAL
jgi:predicted NUDIX family NTP pyrophosphohydrolase